MIEVRDAAIDDADALATAHMFYDRGQLQDPTDRDAAARGYFANGQLHYEEHYRDGKRCHSRAN